MIAKGNVSIGFKTRFGPNWPGQRCGAKTRRGPPCQRPANLRNGKCRLHGGASSGPRTKEGRAKIAAANLKTGEFTKEKIAVHKEQAKIARDIRAQIKVIEHRLRREGIID
jgi:hypothetical protein